MIDTILFMIYVPFIYISSSNAASVQLLVFVELDMQNLPVTYANTGVTALMALVAIVTAEVLHLPLLVDSHFIDRKEAETRT